MKQINGDKNVRRMKGGGGEGREAKHWENLANKGKKS